MRMIRFALLCLSLLLNSASVQAEQYSLQAGAASVAITPAEPIWMAGYAARDRPSEGVEQELYAKALAVEDAHGTRLVVLTMDLIGITRQLREAVAERVAEAHGLPPAGLMMNASHTHCGPELRVDRVANDDRTSDEDVQRVREYLIKLEDRLVAVVGEALEDLAPAELSWSFARAGFAMNRRFPTDTGFINSPNPPGPVDHRVPVLRVDRPEEGLHAVLFKYACHATALSFYDICGDYPGYAQQYLQEARPEVTALFMAGCGGDQNPYPRRDVVPGQEELDLAKQHGRALANAVETALTIREHKPVRGPLNVALGEAKLTFQDPPSREQLLEQAESSNQWDRRYAQRLLEQLEEGELISSYPCFVHVARFGDDDLLLVGLAGEAVVDYSLRLQQELGPQAWIAGYTNEVFGYLPSLRVLREGGYEGGGHMRFTNFPAPFDESIEQRVIGKVHELVEQVGGEPDPLSRSRSIKQRLEPHFHPPEEFAGDLGDYRSPLVFDDGSIVQTAEQWPQRREEIRHAWQTILGSWPEILTNPDVEHLDEEDQGDHVRHRIRFDLLPGDPADAYLLIPRDIKTPRPAVLVVFYEPETAIGEGRPLRDFALQLTRRGFVTLSIGYKRGLENRTYSPYYPSKEEAQLQPLSALAYAAANAYHVLAQRPEVDADRVGIVGHSFGGKWAMFASCLYDRFAAAAWSDGGIVFDESRPNVNYWENWYLGHVPGEWREPWTTPDEEPRTGAYAQLIDTGRDLHELHALMAPRPFLVSGGSEDPPQRWQPLNHTVEVNRLLGYENRVAMTNRPSHGPTRESNETIYLFFEWALKHGMISP